MIITGKHETLKPCPFCKGVRLHIRHAASPVGNAKHVWCQHCGAAGPDQDGPDDNAEAAWNRRDDDPIEWEARVWGGSSVTIKWGVYCGNNCIAGNLDEPTARQIASNHNRLATVERAAWAVVNEELPPLAVVARLKDALTATA
jgi:Lar family restriction alleviation protein